MKQAVRSLLRAPAFALIAVMTLGLGIAANTAIFAIVDELNFKPIANTNLDDVYAVAVEIGLKSPSQLQKPDFETLDARHPPGAVAVAATGGAQTHLIQIPGHATHATARPVSGGYADVFRLRARQGRWISHEDNAGVTGANVMVISERLWRDWFKSRPDVAGRETIQIVEYARSADLSRTIFNRKPYRVMGVAESGFAGDGVDFWVPLGHPPMWTLEETLKCQVDRDERIAKKRPAPDCIQPGVQAYVRTAPGASPSQTAATMTAAVSSRTPTPTSPTGTVVLRPANQVFGLDRLASTGLMILGFASLVFLAACANLSNMLYARATERQSELAVRLSLGASRFRVFRLLVDEALVICGAATALGLGLAFGALQLFLDAFPALQFDYQRRIALDLSLDWRVFLFAAGAGLAATVFVSAASLWRSSRVALLSRLAAAGPAVVGRSEGRVIRTMLVSVQITAAVLLLIASGIYLQNTSRRLDMRVRFDTSGLIAAQIALPTDYDSSRGSHFFEQALARTRKLDGVQLAALADALPGGSAPSPRSAPSAFGTEAPPAGLSGVPRRLNGSWVHASPGLIAALGLKMAEGRDFADADHAAAPRVTIVTESVAEGLWPGENPLGKPLICCGDRMPWRVIGVVSDPVTSNARSPLIAPGNFAFLPAAQAYGRHMMLLARSDSPAALVEPMRQLLVSMDANVPIMGVAPVDHTQFALVASERAARTLAGALGLLALAISVLGVYAVIAYFVMRRRREFGLRMALGATRGQVVKLVVDHSIRMLLIGLIPGVLLASWGTRVFQAELVRLKAGDLTVWIVVPILMLVAGIVAAYIPARRASRVQPISTLKEL